MLPVDATSVAAMAAEHVLKWAIFEENRFEEQPELDRRVKRIPMEHSLGVWVRRLVAGYSEVDLKAFGVVTEARGELTEPAESLRTHGSKGVRGRELRD